MSWNGYVAIGNYSSSVFTESTATGYARAAFTFNGPARGIVQGAGFPILFTATSAATTYNALAFFPTSSGDNALLNFPLATFKYGLSYPYTLNPGSVTFDMLDSVTGDGLQIDLGGAAAISGVQAAVVNHASTAGLTAHAGGGQASAVLLTTTINQITTVATAADSIETPPAIAGSMVFVANAAATNSMNVYPSTGDAIAALGANAAYALAAGHSAWFAAPTQGKWHPVSGT